MQKYRTKTTAPFQLQSLHFYLKALILWPVIIPKTTVLENAPLGLVLKSELR